LKSALLRWVKNQPGTSRIEARMTDSVQNQIESVIAESVPGIDMATALKRMMGNRRLLEKLLRDFARDNQNIIDKIRGMLKNGDLNSARSLVHTLKGVSGNLSAVEVHQASLALETAILQNDQPGIATGLEKLGEKVHNLVTAISSIISITGLEKPEAAKDSIIASTDLTGIGELLQDLDDLLKKNNLNARKFFNILKEKLESGRSKGYLAEIESCLDRLDFKAARKQLSELSRSLGIELK
jgi:two-component system, sensor histidine kinase and response regulator